MSNPTDTPQRMPDSPGERRILNDNAQRLARHHKSSQRLKQSTFIRIDLGQQGAFDIAQSFASEVVTARGIAWVPFAPDFVRGVISLHGEMIAVVDLLAFWGIGKLALSEDQQLLVITSSQRSVAVLLHELVGEVSYAPQQMTKPMAGGHIDERYLQGMHDGNVTVLDTAALLQALGSDSNN